MPNLTGLIILCLLTQNVLADQFGDDLRNALKDPLGQLQKSQVIKVPAHPFNHELNAQNRPKAGEFWLGVVGDSSTTGAAASPHFQATWGNLLAHVFEAIKNIHGHDLGPDEPLPAPLRVMYTPQEFDQAAAKGKALELNVQSDLAQKVDTEEYSFGYIVGRKMSLPADRIVLAGQDGTRVSSLSVQMQRLLSAGPGTLPPLVLVSYVANDLCGDENFTNPVETFRQTFKAELDRQFTSIAALPPDARGTNIMILAPLDVANVLSNEKLLTQKIRFENHGDLTCGDLRRGISDGGDFGRSMESTLVGECRAILGASADPAARLIQLRALQEAQNQVLEQVVTEFNSRGLALHAQYAASTRSIDFQPGDLANDCFHPGRTGANRIADQLLMNELRTVNFAPN